MGKKIFLTWGLVTLIGVASGQAQVIGNEWLDQQDLVTIQNENQRINQLMNLSPNFMSVSATNFQEFSRVPISVQKTKLPNGDALFSQEESFQGFQKLELIHGTEKTVLLGRKDVASLGRHMNLISIQASPKASKALLTFRIDGDNTFARTLIFDLEQRKVLPNITKSFLQVPRFFISENDWMYIKGLNDTSWTAQNLSTFEDRPLTQAEAGQLVAAAQASAAAQLPSVEEAAATTPKPTGKITLSMSQYPSFDGTPIPAAVFYMNDGKPLKDRPVLLDSYGGFGVNTLSSFSMDEMTQKFIEMGGIWMLPGLRGGSERGALWAMAGRGAKNKIKTYEDLAACAKFLTQSGISRPELIVSRGGSNGGLTVAATALLYPNTFGLVVPIAGVLDLLNYHKLDADYYLNWRSDYGNPESIEDRQWLEKIAPISNAHQQGATKFLIMTGDSDDRVNMAHSVHFYEALKEKGGNPENVYLSITAKAGHSLFSAHYSSGAEWLAKNRYWTMIFDHLGMQLPRKNGPR